MKNFQVHLGTNKYDHGRESNNIFVETWGGCRARHISDQTFWLSFIHPGWKIFLLWNYFHISCQMKHF